MSFFRPGNIKKKKIGAFLQQLIANHANISIKTFEKIVS